MARGAFKSAANDLKTCYDKIGMASSDRDLPDFENPPLTEVLISVQFEPIAEMQVPQFGLLWSKFRSGFPRTEQHSPVDAAVEEFGKPKPPKFQLSISKAPPLSRTWFLNEAGSELIQFQLDRFTHNWRKVEGQDSYPRYEHIREQFSKGMGEFRSFLRQESLGEFVPNQCEISYINHIDTNENWATHSELGKVMTVWNPNFQGHYLPELEDVRVATRHVITDEHGNPRGRLHVSAQPAFSGTNAEPILVLTLTVRGAPIEPCSNGVLAFVDQGREVIVRGFASITTSEMHKIWRRTK